MIEDYYRHGRWAIEKKSHTEIISERDRDDCYSSYVRTIEDVPIVAIKKTSRNEEGRNVVITTKIQLNDVGQIIADLETLLKKYNSWVEICNSSPDYIGQKEMPLEPTLKKYIIADFSYGYLRSEDRWLPRINIYFLEEYYFWEYPTNLRNDLNEIPICDLIEFFTLIYNEYCGENSLWSKLI